ncbi:MAG: nicotinate-nucleotide adenylyltransferase [Congregibacter sp.]
MRSTGAVAVFGGTFNPIHHGHLRSALELLESLPLKELRFLPSRQPPHRDAPEVSAEHRAAMVELAIAGEPRFVCDRRELTRDGPSYTYDTLLSLRKELGPRQSLCLVLGCDAALGLPSWHRWEELLSLAHMVVMARPGWAIPPAGAFTTWLNTHIEPGISLTERPCGSIFLRDLRPLDISATELRGLLQSRKSPRYLMPAEALDYAIEHELYTVADVTSQ